MHDSKKPILKEKIMSFYAATPKFALTILCGLLFANAAFAAKEDGNGQGKETPVWSEQVIVINSSGLGTFSVDGQSFSFTASSGIRGAYYNANLVPNSEDAIASSLISSGIFGLSSNSTLRIVGSANNLSGKTATISGLAPYNFLAVHVGGGELLFNWVPLNNSSFTINSSRDNLSNFRAYASNGMGSANVTPVPEPETYAMLLAGLCVVGATVRRKRNLPTL